MGSSLHPDLVARGTVTHGTIPHLALEWGLNLADIGNWQRSAVWVPNQQSGSFAQGFYRAGNVALPSPVTTYTGQRYTVSSPPTFANGDLYVDCSFEGDLGANAKSDVVFRGCRFTRGQFSWTNCSECVFLDCDFRESTVLLGRGCSQVGFAGCRWYGRGPYHGPYRLFSGDQIAFVGCSFEFTARGAILQCDREAGDAITRCMWLGNRYFGITQCRGGDEWLAEGNGPYHDNLWLHERYHGTLGGRIGWQMAGGDWQRNVFYNLEAENLWFGVGAFEGSYGDYSQNVQTDNYWMRCVFDGGGFFDFGARATGNDIWECTWIRRSPFGPGNNHGNYKSAAASIPSAIYASVSAANTITSPNYVSPEAIVTITWNE